MNEDLLRRAVEVIEELQYEADFCRSCETLLIDGRDHEPDCAAEAILRDARAVGARSSS